MDAWSSVWTISDHVVAGNGPNLAIWTILSLRYRFWVNFTKATLIPNKKRMLGVQSGPYWTMWWPGMAETWQSGPSPASDIDFGANFTKATLIPNKKNGCMEFSLDHIGPCGGWKWPKLGSLDHPQPQISILGQISLKQH